MYTHAHRLMSSRYLFIILTSGMKKVLAKKYCLNTNTAETVKHAEKVIETPRVVDGRSGARSTCYDRLHCRGFGMDPVFEIIPPDTDVVGDLDGVDTAAGRPAGRRTDVLDRGISVDISFVLSSICRATPCTTDLCRGSEC